MIDIKGVWSQWSVWKRVVAVSTLVGLLVTVAAGVIMLIEEAPPTNLVVENQKFEIAEQGVECGIGADRAREIYVEYPVIRGFRSKEFERKLNAEVKQIAIGRFDVEEMIELTASFDLISQTEDSLSFVIRGYMNTRCAAHGYTFTDVFNINKRKERKIIYREAFKEGSEMHLKPLFVNYLERRGVQHFLSQTQLSEPRFVLDGAYVRFFFPMGSIAPMAAGDIQIRLEPRKLRDVLLPDGTLSFLR